VAKTNNKPIPQNHNYKTSLAIKRELAFLTEIKSMRKKRCQTDLFFNQDIA
jgi:hypothetical protein